MVLSKLKAVPGAIRGRLPGRGAPDLPGPDLADAAPDVPDAVPVPETDDLPDSDDLPETSGRDKLTLGLTLLSVVGVLLAVVGFVARVIVKRRRTEPGVDIDVVDEGEADEIAEPVEREYPKVAPLVGMAALVGMRLVVERLARPTDDE